MSSCGPTNSRTSVLRCAPRVNSRSSKEPGAAWERIADRVCTAVHEAGCKEQPSGSGLRLRLVAEENRELRRALAVWLRRLVLPELIGSEELPPLEELEEIESMLAAKRLTWPERWKEERGVAGRYDEGARGRPTGRRA